MGLQLRYHLVTPLVGLIKTFRFPTSLELLFSMKGKLPNKLTN